MLLLPIYVTDALRVMETGFFKRSIDKANLAVGVSDYVCAGIVVSIYQQYAIVASIRNDDHRVVDPLLLFDADDLSWKLEVLRSCVLVFFLLDRVFLWTLLLLFQLYRNSHVFIQFWLIVLIGDGEEEIERLPVAFTTENQDRNATRTQDDKSRPTPPLEVSPN